MWKDALQEFDDQSERTMSAIMQIPLEIRERLNLRNMPNDGAPLWLDVVDALAAAPGAPDQVKGFARDQFRVLKNDADSASPVLVPIMAYRANRDSLPPDAFPHSWVAVVSPDIATCASAAIDEMLRKLPDPASDFTIATWIEHDGGKTTWTVHDSQTVAALQESYGKPAKRYDHEGSGVSGTALIGRLDTICAGDAAAHACH